MNAGVKKILSYVVVFILGAVVCVFVAKGYYSGEVDRLSKLISSGEDINTELRADNERLRAENVRSTETVGRLEKQLADDNRRTQSILGGIQTALSSVSTGLNDTAGDLQSIIDGMSTIADLIRVLP